MTKETITIDEIEFKLDVQINLTLRVCRSDKFDAGCTY